MKSKVLVLLWISILFSLSAHGKEQSLSEVYKSALEKSQTEGINRSQIAQSEENLTQIKSTALPQLNAIGTYTKQDPVPSANAFTRSDQYNGRLNLRQPLFRGFREFDALKVSRLRINATESSAEAIRRDLYRNVASLFYQVLAAEKNLKNSQSLLNVTESRVKDLTARVKIGRSRKGELLAAQSQFAAAKSQWIASETTLEQQRLALHSATGLEVNIELKDSIAVPRNLPKVDEILNKVENHPSILAQKKELEATEIEIDFARGGHWPTLDFEGNYWLRRTGVQEDVKWDVGLLLTFPLYTGGQNQSAVRLASARKMETELRYVRLKRELQTEAEGVYAVLTQSIRQEKALSEAASLAEKNYNEQQRDYKFGLVTNLEVLQAINFYFESVSALDRQTYATKASIADLQALIGELP